jgi:hemerythrin-like domain-containing protein
MFIRIGATADHDFNEPLGLLSDCHRRIEHFLGVIARIVDDAGGAPLSPAQHTDLEAALRYFSTAAPRHTADEEQSLFPRLRAHAEATAVIALAARLAGEHEVADGHHASVHALGHRWLASGRLDDDSIEQLRGHVGALQALYREHIAVEDSQLFPAAARLLTTDEIGAIGSEMAGRRGVSFPRDVPPAE